MNVLRCLDFATNKGAVLFPLSWFLLVYMADFFLLKGHFSYMNMIKSLVIRDLKCNRIIQTNDFIPHNLR